MKKDFLVIYDFGKDSSFVTDRIVTANSITEVIEIMKEQCPNYRIFSIILLESNALEKLDIDKFYELNKHYRDLTRDALISYEEEIK